MEPAKDTQEAKRATRRGKRLVIAAYITVSTVFVGLSTIQIVPQVLGMGIQPLAVGSSPDGKGCVDGVRTLSSSLDRAVARAGPGTATSRTGGYSAADEEATVAAFRGSLSPEWDDEPGVEHRCAGDPRGKDALAALLRLRLAEEHFLRRQVVEIAPLRSDVAAYLPH